MASVRDTLRRWLPSQAPDKTTPEESSISFHESDATMVVDTAEIATEHVDYTELEASLVILSGEDVGTKYPIHKDKVLVGRSQSEADLMLSDAGVSRQHAVLYKRDDVYFLEDLDSTNGTLLNGREIKEVALNDGDRIQVGDSVLQFRLSKGVPNEG